MSIHFVVVQFRQVSTYLADRAPSTNGYQQEGTINEQADELERLVGPHQQRNIPSFLNNEEEEEEESLARKFVRVLHVGSYDHVLTIRGERHSQNTKLWQYYLMDMANHRQYHLGSHKQPPSVSQNRDYLQNLYLPSMVHDTQSGETYCMFGREYDKGLVDSVYIIEPAHYLSTIENCIEIRRIPSNNPLEDACRLAELHQLTVNTDSDRTGGGKPEPRLGQSAVFVPGQSSKSIYVFGGCGNGQYLNDLWRLNLLTHEWTRIHGCFDAVARLSTLERVHMRYLGVHNALLDPPSPTTTAMTDPFSVPGNGAATSVHTRNHGCLPSKRYGHTAVYDRTTDWIFVFGGKIDVNDVCDNGLFSFDMKTAVWKKMVAADSLQPEPRFGHSAVCTKRGRMIVYAGHGTHQIFNDLWTCDLANGRWSRIEMVVSPRLCEYYRIADQYQRVPSSSYNEKRFHHESWMQGDGCVMYVMGGLGENEKPMYSCLKITLPGKSDLRHMQTDLCGLRTGAHFTDCEIVFQRMRLD